MLVACLLVGGPQWLKFELAYGISAYALVPLPPEKTECSQTCRITGRSKCRRRRAWSRSLPAVPLTPVLSKKPVLSPACPTQKSSRQYSWKEVWKEVSLPFSFSDTRRIQTWSSIWIPLDTSYIIHVEYIYYYLYIMIWISIIFIKKLFLEGELVIATNVTISILPFTYMHTACQSKGIKNLFEKGGTTAWRLRVSVDTMSVPTENRHLRWIQFFSLVDKHMSDSKHRFSFLSLIR